MFSRRTELGPFPPAGFGLDSTRKQRSTIEHPPRQRAPLEHQQLQTRQQIRQTAFTLYRLQYVGAGQAVQIVLGSPGDFQHTTGQATR